MSYPLLKTFAKFDFLEIREYLVKKGADQNDIHFVTSKLFKGEKCQLDNIVYLIYDGFKPIDKKEFPTFKKY